VVMLGTTRTNALFFAPKTFFLPSLSLQMITSSSSNNCTSSASTSPNQLLLLRQQQQQQQLSNQYYALRHGQSKANIANIISSDPKISTIEHGLTDVGKDQVYNSAILFCKNYHQEHSSTITSSSASSSASTDSDMNNDNTNGNDDNDNDDDDNRDATTSTSTVVAIYASDFTRARETALIFAQVLRENNVPLLFLNNHNNNNNNNNNDKNTDSGNDNSSGVKFDKRLRERYFGQFNGESDSHYQDVWDEDCIDPNHTKYDVESVNSVVRRTTELILDIEQSISTTTTTTTTRSSGTCTKSNDDDDNDNDNRRSHTRCKVILVAHGDVLQILQTAFLNVDGSIHRSLDHLETACVRELKFTTK